MQSYHGGDNIVERSHGGECCHSLPTGHEPLIVNNCSRSAYNSLADAARYLLSAGAHIWSAYHIITPSAALRLLHCCAVYSSSASLNNTIVPRAVHDWLHRVNVDLSPGVSRPTPNSSP